MSHQFTINSVVFCLPIIDLYLLLVSHPIKIFEYVIVCSIIKHLETNILLYNLQHDFQRGLSCETQPISLFDDLTLNYDKDLNSNLFDNNRLC